MSSKSGNSVLFGGIIILVLVAGFTAMSQYAGNQGGNPLEDIPEGIPTEQPEVPIAETPATQATNIGAVLLHVRTGATSRIVRREQGQPDKTLFTDADETEKVQQFVGQGTGLMYALVGLDPNSSGKVASIKLDGSGTLELLSELILSSSPPAVRPDGQRLALVSFDNAERSFGFTLKTQTLNAAGVLSIDSSQSGLALPRWSADGTQLAFTKGQTTPEAGQEIRVAAHEANPTTVYTTDKNIAVTDLVWAGSNALLLVLEPLGNETQNRAKLVRLSLSSKTIATFVDAEGKERGLAASPDGAFAGFITGNVSTGTSLPTGTVTVRSLTSDQTANLGQAQSVLGWSQ